MNIQDGATPVRKDSGTLHHPVLRVAIPQSQANFAHIVNTLNGLTKTLTLLNESWLQKELELGRLSASSVLVIDQFVNLVDNPSKEVKEVVITSVLKILSV